MHVRKLLSAALLLVVTAACGGGTPGSPASPGPVQATAAPTGATIVGMVRTGTARLAASTGSAVAGLTVTVAGTNLSATVGATGQFTLNGVPAGNVRLNFSGPGVNATITIPGVDGSETITITVKVSGSQAELEDEAHENHGEAQLNGNVVDLSGDASSFQFRIGGTQVRGDAQTTFFGDGNRSDDFADLHNGDRVEVKGATREGFVYAQRLHINNRGSHDDDDDDEDADDDDDEDDEDDDADDDDDDGDDDDEDEDANEAEVEGSIAALNRSCPNATFTISGAQVATSGATEYKGVSCDTLQNGTRVKVEGPRQNGVIAAREIKRKP